MGFDGYIVLFFLYVEGFEYGLVIDDLVCVINVIESDVIGKIIECMMLILFVIVDFKVVKLLISGEEKFVVYK